jgi:hypothetical protein
MQMPNTGGQLVELDLHEPIWIAFSGWRRWC